MKKINLFIISFLITSCSITPNFEKYSMIEPDNFSKLNKNRTHILINLDEQTLLLKTRNKEKIFPISSSAYGIGNIKNSFKTPLGAHVISEKIGKRVPKGAIFKGRMWTNEIAKIVEEPIDIPEDVITSRILWLDGLEENRNRGGIVDSKSRYIYIHGTAEEGLIGKPASLGCIRMLNDDVIEIFKKVRVGTQVLIFTNKEPYKTL